MRQKTKMAAIVALTVLAVVLSVWGPEALAKYQDRSLLNQTYTKTATRAGEGYLYKLSVDDKLYLLARCLSSQTLPESEQSALTRQGGSGPYQDLKGSYTFLANYRSPSEKEITDDEVYETCSRAVDELGDAGVIPGEIREITAEAYDATLYSAIDILEPRNNIAVWKVSLSDSTGNRNKENCLMDAYLDAEDGKIYEFYVRTSLLWEEIDVDALIAAWSSYMGLSEPEPYESENPLLEATPYYKKYVFAATEEERTIVTVGVYEVINELFLKISR